MAIGTTAAILTGLGISAGTSVAKGVIGSKSSKKAAGQQEASIKEAEDVYKSDNAEARNVITDNMWRTREDFGGYSQRGGDAFQRLADFELDPGGYLTRTYDEYDFTPEDFKAGKDPGYEWLLAEGEKTLQRSAAAKHGVLSPGTSKALTRYSQGMASQEYAAAEGRAFNKWKANSGKFRDEQNDRRKGLLDLSKFGYDSENAKALYGGQSAREIADLYEKQGRYTGDLRTDKGNVRAAGTIGSSNAWSDSIGDLGDLASMAVWSLPNKKGVTARQATSRSRTNPEIMDIPV